MINTIPQTYVPEFIQKQIVLIKSRVALFCSMVVVLYLSSTTLGFFLSSQTFKKAEIPVAILLILGGGFLLYLNAKATTLVRAKVNAFLFTALLFWVVARLSFVYYEYAAFEVTMFVFILFFVALIIPWTPLEILGVALMDVAAYTGFFVFARQLSWEQVAAHVAVQSYYEGLIVLSMAVAICMVVRRKETSRDRENFVLFKDIETKNQQIQRELVLATAVHKSLVPRSVSTPLVDIAVFYQPASYLGGDYVTFYVPDRHRLLFVICDVTGHGVPAALLVNRLHIEFARLVEAGLEPGAILRDSHEFVLNNFKGTNMFVSAFCGQLDFRHKKLLYSNYGHPPQYIFQVCNSRVLALEAQRSFLGAPVPQSELFQKEVRFAQRDKIFLFTDGVTETMNPNRAEYGKGRLENFIQNNHTRAVTEFNEVLVEDLNAFSKGEFQDDIALLSIAIK